MKRMKRLLSFILVSVMALAMSLTAFAADPTTTIRIEGEGKQFFAYRLLNASQSADGSTTSYSLNPKYTGILQTLTGASGDAIIDAIADMDDAQIRTFADAAYKAIEQAGLAADATTTTKVFENIPQGYYLIYENQKADDVTNPDGTVKQDQYSLTMLGTAGVNEKKIKTKESEVVVDKKVKEKNDSTGATTGWQDAADYDLGDDVPFKLEGTINENFRQFNSYYYEFVDELSAGLTYNNDARVYINEGGQDITSYFTITYTVDTANLTHISVKCEDLKAVAALGAKDHIVVLYTAKVNNRAVIGQPGNPNKVKLIYSNRPDKTDKGETPEDRVVVFTYKLLVNKVDKDGKELAGAGFTLYKKVPAGTTGAVTLDGHDGVYVVVQEITGVTTFEFSRIDAADYVLVETTVPSGYNKAEDITFTVKATYDTDSADPKLTGLEVVNITPADATFRDGGFQDYLSKGQVETSIVNKAGVELPETGGIGTTIFYIVGALMMVGAGVVLVTRRRLSK